MAVFGTRRHRLGVAVWIGGVSIDRENGGL